MYYDITHTEKYDKKTKLRLHVKPSGINATWSPAEPPDGSKKENVMIRALNVIEKKYLKIENMKMSRVRKEDRIPVLEFLESVVAGNRLPVPCGECTACCRAYKTIDLTAEEQKRLLHIDGSLKTNPDGSCVYLADSGCSIYDERPMACRNFDCRIQHALGISCKALEAADATPSIAFFLYDTPYDRAIRYLAVAMVVSIVQEHPDISEDDLIAAMSTKLLPLIPDFRKNAENFMKWREELSAEEQEFYRDKTLEAMERLNEDIRRLQSRDINREPDRRIERLEASTAKKES